MRKGGRLICGLLFLPFMTFVLFKKTKNYYGI
jgi:hypothetical protein